MDQFYLSYSDATNNCITEIKCPATIGKQVVSLYTEQVTKGRV